MVYNKDYTRYHRKMNNDPVFFDYESEEYRELRIRADASESEAKVAGEILDRTRKEYEAAQRAYYAARARADIEFKPLNEWYKKQSQAQDQWRRDQREAERRRTEGS